MTASIPARKPRGKRTLSPPKPGDQDRINSAQFIVWTMSGGPLPSHVVEKLDEAIQKVMDEAKVRLFATKVVV